MHDETMAIHGGYTPDSTRAVAVPVYQTVAHDFADADQAGALFDLEAPGFHYNRLNNPTVDVLEQRLAALEGGAAALAVSSGAAAVSMSILNLVGVGDNFVSAPKLYGATYTYFAHVLPRSASRSGSRRRQRRVDRRPDRRPHEGRLLREDRQSRRQCHRSGRGRRRRPRPRGAADRRQHGRDAAAAQAVRPRRRRRRALAHEVRRRPRHHARRRHHRRRPVPVGRPPGSVRLPDRARAGLPRRAVREAVREAAYVVRCRTVGLRNTGATLSPFNAFLLLQGLETLAVRLDRHEANARAVAAYLAADPRVASVSFLAFPTIPTTSSLADTWGIGARRSSRSGPRRLRRRNSGLQPCEPVQAGGQHGRRQVAGHAPRVHDAPPAHAAALELVGVTPDMIRLSVGLEHIDDLLEDIDQALTAAV